MAVSMLVSLLPYWNYVNIEISPVLDKIYIWNIFEKFLGYFWTTSKLFCISCMSVSLLYLFQLVISGGQLLRPLVLLGLNMILIPYLVLQVIGTVLAVVYNLLYVSLGYELTLDVGSENWWSTTNKSVPTNCSTPSKRKLIAKVSIIITKSYQQQSTSTEVSHILLRPTEKIQLLSPHKKYWAEILGISSTIPNLIFESVLVNPIGPSN